MWRGKTRTLEGNVTHRSAAASIAAGWAVGVALYGLLYAVLPWQESERQYPYWAMITNQLGTAFVSVIPGLVAGYLAGRLGLSVGAMAGGLAALTIALVAATASWPSVMLASHVTASFAANTFAAVVAALVTNGIAGVAGIQFRRLPSNSTPHTDARASSVPDQPPSARAGERGR